MSTNAVPTQLSHDRPLWQPDAGRIAASNLEQFRIRAEQRTGLSLPDYAALHRWSVEDRAGFWQLVWDFCEVVGERGNTALVDNGHMRDAKFFPDAKLNFAENLLRKTGSEEAIVFFSRRGQGRAPSDLGRSSRAGVEIAAVHAGGRR